MPNDVKYTLHRGNTSGINNTQIVDGQIFFDKEKHRILMDAYDDNNQLQRIIMTESTTFVGTQEQWESLTDAEKAKYTYQYITDDYVAPNNIMVGATALENGSPGLAPRALAGEQHKVLTGGATYVEKQDVMQYSLMPTAEAELVDAIVQYTGASISGSYQNGYFYKCVSDGGVYSWDAIPVQAGGSSSGGHTIKDEDGVAYTQRSNLVFANATVEDDPVNDATVVTATGGGGDVPIGDVTSATVVQDGDTVVLKWTDPNDVVISDFTFATWAGTTVVRKIGSAPSSVSDGTVVLNNTVRNQYSISGYVDRNLVYGNTYFYRFFPYKLNGSAKMYTTGTALDVTIERTVITTVPSQSGTLTYDGSSQEPTWNDYNTDELAISGDVDGINAGTYIASFTPKTGYQWEGANPLAPKDITWTIGKAVGSATISPLSLTLDADHLTGTFTVSDGTGAITLASANTNIAIVSPGSMTASGGIATVSSVNETSGSTTIDVTVAESANYLTETIEVEVECAFAPESLEDATWAQIQDYGNKGTGANVFAIGDTKTITLNGTIGASNLVLNNYQCKVFIIEFNYRGDNGIYFQGFKSMDATPKDIALCDSHYNSNSSDGSKWFNMNHWGNASASPYNTNYGGWKGCDLRYDILGSTNQAPSGYGSTATTSRVGYDATSAAKTNPVSNTLMAALPNDLRTVLAAWTIYSDNKGNSSNVETNVTTSVDYLPLLAEYEIHGSRSYANQYENTNNKQKQMTYYTNGNSKVKYNHSNTGAAVIWWCRSPHYNNAYHFCGVATSGGASYSNSCNSRGLAPGFRVA